MKRKLIFFLAATMLLPLSMVGHARADIPGLTAIIWNIRAVGIWRTEYRTREIARWYQHYEWKFKGVFWLKGRKEGIWVESSNGVRSFRCHRHCVYRFPDGRVWRIWRWFVTKRDVVRFKSHYKFCWLPIGNPLLVDVPEAQDRFALALDHLELTLPMTPSDPDPNTPNINEAVMI